MGLEKAIAAGKEHRKPYRGAKAFACSCRNNGGCPYCLANRMHSRNREEARAKDAIRDAWKEVRGE